MGKDKKDSKFTSNEDHELDYYKRKWGVSRKAVRQAKSAVGVSRRKIFAWLILNNKIPSEHLGEFDKAVLGDEAETK